VHFEVAGLSRDATLRKLPPFCAYPLFRTQLFVTLAQTSLTRVEAALLMSHGPSKLMAREY